MAEFCNTFPILADKLGISVCKVLCVSKKLMTLKVCSERVFKTQIKYWKQYLKYTTLLKVVYRWITSLFLHITQTQWGCHTLRFI